MQLYQKLLNQLNILYIIIEIKTLKFEELNFLISFIINISAFIKIIIFVNNIKIATKMITYL